jgi:hypothetical protein
MQIIRPDEARTADQARGDVTASARLPESVALRLRHTAAAVADRRAARNPRTGQMTMASGARTARSLLLEQLDASTAAGMANRCSWLAASYPVKV